MGGGVGGFFNGYFSSVAGVAYLSKASNTDDDCEFPGVCALCLQAPDVPPSAELSALFLTSGTFRSLERAEAASVATASVAEVTHRYDHTD